MKTRIWILIGMLMGVIVSCSEDSISPSTDPETFDGLYSLPQGNHDYDVRIVELSNKYNTRIYYKFVDKDYYWGVSTDIRWRFDTVNNKIVAGYDALPADENYVGEQLDLLENHFLKYFSDTLLLRTMPYRVLLSSVFDYIIYSSTGMPEVLPRTLVNAYSGYDYLAFNWGNANVKTMTSEQINAFKNDAVCVFLQRLADKELIKRSTAFTSVTNYGASMTAANMYEFGILHYSYRTIAGDWEQYVKAIVSTPYEQLIAPGGILHPDIDKKQMIRKKYDYMINHFKEEYNIDLQAIGDDVQN